MKWQYGRKKEEKMSSSSSGPVGEEKKIREDVGEEHAPTYNLGEPIFLPPREDHVGPESSGSRRSSPSSLASQHKKLILCCDLETGIDELREVPCDAAEDLCAETQMDTQFDED